MKKVSAFILAIIYLAFTAGITADTSSTETAIYAATLSAGDNSEFSIENEAVEKDGSVVKTNTHHTAPVGKTKLPRASVTSQRIFSFSPTSHSLYALAHFTNNTAAGLPAHLYIRNCALLL